MPTALAEQLHSLPNFKGEGEAQLGGHTLTPQLTIFFLLHDRIFLFFHALEILIKFLHVFSWENKPAGSPEAKF